MQALYSLAAFLVAVGLLVLIHELGHYLVARAFGVHVERFSVGFGKALVAWRDRRGTEWVVAALPLGGYVKMLDGRAGAIPAGWEKRAFDHQPPWVKIAIVLAGPLANGLLAVVAYAFMAFWGVMEAKPIVAEPAPGTAAAEAGLRARDEIIAVGEKEVRGWNELRWRLVAAAASDEAAVELSVLRNGEQLVRTLSLVSLRWDPDEGDPLQQLGLNLMRLPQPAVVGRVETNSPAAQAGIMPGDRIRAIDGVELAHFEALAAWVREHPGKQVVLEIERGAERFELELTLGRLKRGERESGWLGVAADHAAPSRQLVRYSGWEALLYGFDKSAEMTLLTLKFLLKMVQGEASLKNLAGPLTIADAAGATAQLGLSPFLGFLAMVSISLMVLNLLPIPILDGGHLLYHLAEWVRGGPLPEVVELWGQRIGFVLLLGLMGVAFVNDLWRWMRG